MPQHRKKEESERLRGDGDQIKFIGLGLERWQCQTKVTLLVEYPSRETEMINISFTCPYVVCELNTTRYK